MKQEFFHQPTTFGRAIFVLSAAFLAFGIVLGSVMFHAAISPCYYETVARIQVDSDGSWEDVARRTSESITSEQSIGRVIKELGLEEKWAGQFHYSSAATRRFLRWAIEARPIRISRLIDVRARCRDSGDAARIANKLAEMRASDSPRIWIIDQASPGRRPVLPRVALRFFLGSLAGLATGFAVAVFLLRRSEPPLGPSLLATEETRKGTVSTE